MRRPRATVDAARIVFESFGVRAEVSVSPAEGLDHVRPLLPPGWRACPGAEAQKRFALHADDGGVYAVLKDDEPFVEHLPIDVALALLEAQIRAYVALHAPDRIFVHAGVVAHRGRAIVIPGMSFSGKTTLVAALVRAGATYYSDEFAPLDAEGMVHPYAKPLSVRDDGQVQHDHTVESMGGVAGEQPLPVGLVVATEYAPAAEWHPQRLSPGEGVLRLLSNTVAAQTRPEQVMQVLRRAVDGAAVIASLRGEASELVGLLLEDPER